MKAEKRIVDAVVKHVKSGESFDRVVDFAVSVAHTSREDVELTILDMFDHGLLVYDTGYIVRAGTPLGSHEVELRRPRKASA